MVQIPASLHIQVQAVARLRGETVSDVLRFKRAIGGLASNPRPANAEEMREPDYFKIKFGTRAFFEKRLAQFLEKYHESTR